MRIFDRIFAKGKEQQTPKEPSSEAIPDVVANEYEEWKRLFREGEKREPTEKEQKKRLNELFVEYQIKRKKKAREVKEVRPIKL